jgi:hypothetical protein
MTDVHGYISRPGCLTVDELRRVLDAADGDDSVHVVPLLATGDSQPVKAAMAADASADEHRVYLYLDHPGET